METGECIRIGHILRAVLFRREMKQRNPLSSIIVPKWGRLIRPVETMGAICIFAKGMLRLFVVEF